MPRENNGIVLTVTLPVDTVRIDALSRSSIVVLGQTCLLGSVGELVLVKRLLCERVNISVALMPGAIGYG